MTTNIDDLKAIIDAQQSIIDWYEDESDRSNHAADEIDQELFELEQALHNAKVQAMQSKPESERVDPKGPLQEIHAIIKKSTKNRSYWKDWERKVLKILEDNV